MSELNKKNHVICGCANYYENGNNINTGMCDIRDASHGLNFLKVAFQSWLAICSISPVFGTDQVNSRSIPVHYHILCIMGFSTVLQVHRLGGSFGTPTQYSTLPGQWLAACRDLCFRKMLQICSGSPRN